MKLDTSKENNSRYEIPIWRKVNLSIEEAVIYSGIGRNKLYGMTNEENCPFVLWVGGKRLIKKTAFDEYIKNSFEI